MNVLKPVGFPRWFVALNYVALSPILVWPIMVFLAGFAGDGSSVTFFNYLLFFLFIFYPVLLLGIVATSYRLFDRYRRLSIFLSLIPIMVVLFVAVKLFVAMNYPTPNY